MTSTFAALRDAFDHVRIEEAAVEETAVDFNYTPHVRKIIYEDAIAIALQHQLSNPEWMLCGSLALMITGTMKPSDVSDVDFATNVFPRYVKIISTKYNKHNEGMPSYYHCEYSEFVDVFVHSHAVSGEVFKYRGLRVQNIQEVLKWKRHFNRNKDKDDLMQIYLPESLFEI